MKKLQSCVTLVCCSLLLVLSAAAQVQNGQFTGPVLDPSGAAIVGAKVKVTNTATGLTVSLTTNQSGFYVAKEMPPGSYKITAEASALITRTETNLTFNATIS